MHALPRPYLIFLGAESSRVAAKTGIGVAHWARADCIGQWRTSAEAVDLALPPLGPQAAAAHGARSLLIGVSPFGGQLPDAWIGSLVEALSAGLDIVSGLHARLGDTPAIADAARRFGRTLHDVRHHDRPIPLATGQKRSGRRVLTVGTDCALGKKFTALALTDALRARGMDADFRATGQTGIMIAGSGIAIDAVVADFIAGAAEQLSPDAADTHWDVIEGQGAILHPAYAGVTLGLLHGSQPDALILCHDPTRATLAGFGDRPVPPLEAVMPLYRTLARVTNPAAEFVAIALNTSALGDAEARATAARIGAEHGLPAFDPVRFGIEPVAELLANY